MPAFNPLVETLTAPPIPHVQSWARAYSGACGPLIDLSQAVPGYAPHHDLLAALGQCASDPRLAGYGAIEGEPELRTAYAKHVAGLYGTSVHMGSVQITAGCNQAFTAALMAVASAGDAVLLTNPCYFNHETTLTMLGISANTVACKPELGFVPGAADIDTAITPKTKAVVLVSPNNPTGAVYPAELLCEIFDLCKRRGIWLILDETYRDFMDPLDLASGPMGREDWRENLIQLYSFSKSFCIPGHRLGAVTAGEAVIRQMAKVMDNLQICAPRAVQHAVAPLIPVLENWREQNRQEINRRASAMQSSIALVPGWKLNSIGAYFAFVRHPYPGRTSADVAQQLAKQLGLITLPGSYFGEELDDFLRLAFANVEVSPIQEACARLKSLT
ncbi:aminotransferase [Aureimonas fodinaquatilis]|uniref:aspartate transaminase n=1 Tax=Aureimonas fodinaquatilis TaxID=2565783 RepID=A0A5B0E017_9HYPH|nr:aminotransferase [Aureimonas fodinaquatilis]KAA0971271.1 aminotransferase [Aureimonas fodinaquatilis]